MFKVSGRISTKTGFAPVKIIELIVEANVIGVVITSSFFFKFKLIKDRCNAAVQEFTDIACFIFFNFENLFSKFWVTLPVPSQKDLITLLTELISLASTNGFPNEMNFLDDTEDI